MNILFALFIIVFEAVPEALRDIGKKTFAGSFEFFYRIYVPAMTFLWMTEVSAFFHSREQSIWVLLIGYVLLRYGLFNIIYNAVRGDVPLFYIGTTKRFDKFLRSLKIHPSLLAFSQAIAALWGLAWLAGWRFGIIPL